MYRDDGEDEEEEESSEAPKILSLGERIERIPIKGYSPDKFLLDRWDKVLKCPHVLAEDSDQVRRLVYLHNAIIVTATYMLKMAPNSYELDKALSALHEAQSWAITAVQANE